MEERHLLPLLLLHLACLSQGSARTETVQDRPVIKILGSVLCIGSPPLIRLLPLHSFIRLPKDLHFTDLSLHQVLVRLVTVSSLYTVDPTFLSSPYWIKLFFDEEKIINFK